MSEPLDEAQAAQSAEKPTRALRERTRVTGRVVAITYPSKRATATIQAHIQDEAGTLLVSWSGRRDIPGIRVGQMLSVEGVTAMVDSQPHMFNPRYEILADTEGE
ncbi:MAG: hypothetical protein Q4P05_05060 [Actinomycetaceae bacterium]|nr:hypothetical protein [Actinomycetaceae bacterium]